LSGVVVVVVVVDLVLDIDERLCLPHLDTVELFVWVNKIVKNHFLEIRPTGI
jgi:hypothetical protein